mmetsp:Transcript_440/g.523  ORF Transcript_440/g.523 Transcript_440/m.523 type:complete len:232 (+) Transcript_440:555-1250(+)
MHVSTKSILILEKQSTYCKYYQWISIKLHETILPRKPSLRQNLIQNNHFNSVENNKNIVLVHGTGYMVIDSLFIFPGVTSKEFSLEVFNSSFISLIKDITIRVGTYWAVWAFKVSKPCFVETSLGCLSFVNISNWGSVQLLRIEIAFIQEQNYPRFNESFMINNIFEQRQCFFHTIYSFILIKTLVIFIDCSNKDYGLYFVETVYPFTALVTLSANIPYVEVNSINGKLLL